MDKLLLSAAALAVAVPAMAQVQAPIASMAPIAPRMEATQTRDQAIAKVRTHFAKMDANRDGFVGTDEMRAMRGQHQGMDHQMGERRGQGAQAAFDWLDANRDNMINRSEFAAGRQVRGERMGARGAAPTAMVGDRPAMGAMHRMNGGGRMGGGRMMKMADLDRDGRVSLQEATTSALERFDRVDANRDGRITPEERRHNRDMRKQMRAPKAG